MKIVLGLIGILLINGCGDITGDTAHNDYTSEYYYTENNIDYGSGTVLSCNDSKCTVLGGKGTTGGDAVVGQYDPTYTQTECNAAGFFYCTVQDKCLNQRVDDSSSSCSK
jgi:hypothetical protein